MCVIFYIIHIIRMTRFTLHLYPYYRPYLGSSSVPHASGEFDLVVRVVLQSSYAHRDRAAVLSQSFRVFCQEACVVLRVT
jgi:hypothetical protein